jgi:hypothetical protein
MSNIDQQTDYAAEVVSRLSKDYAELMNSVATTLASLRSLPKTIDDEAVLDQYATVIRDARDLNKRLDSYHDSEKTPYLRAGQGVDQFFFGQMEKLARRKKTDPAGGLDIADARVDDYMQRKLAAERAERARIEAEERAKADAIRKQQEEAARAAAEAVAKAARARNAETIAAHKAEAERQAAIAEEARQRQALADQQAEDARIDTIAKPADMTRTRLDSGAMATMGEVPVVQIDDVTALDKAVLWPFLKDEHILMALKAWAKTKSHKTPMAGATIKMVPKGQVR